MTVRQIKAKIRLKFGSYSNFARATGIDRTTLQNDFLLKTTLPKGKIDELDALCEATDKFTLGKTLTQEQLTDLRVALTSQGGVPVFCKNNPEFGVKTVYQTMWGNKVITKKVMRLFEVLNMPL